MSAKPRNRPMLGLLAAALALIVAGGSALASVTVYRNTFSSKTDAKELRHVEGKHCSKRFRERAKALRITAKRGREVCGYRPPVEGDGPGPDHRLQVTAKLLKHTPKGVRDGAYVAVE